VRAAVRVVVSEGHRIIYGGARNGLMGVVADEALRLGGTVVGVRNCSTRVSTKSTSLLRCTSANASCRLAEAFLAFPGGAGTLEEIMEQWTWTQLGIHAKPCGVLDIDGYFLPLRMMVDKMVDEGFLAERHKASLIFSGSVEDVLAGLQQFEMPEAKH
jgi:uncharacterized protein (TIGR00730 family)